MIRLFARLTELWDTLCSRHDKAAKVTVAVLLLALCAAVAVLQVRQLAGK